MRRTIPAANCLYLYQGGKRQSSIARSWDDLAPYFARPDVRPQPETTQTKERTLDMTSQERHKWLAQQDSKTQLEMMLLSQDWGQDRNPEERIEVDRWLKKNGPGPFKSGPEQLLWAYLDMPREELGKLKPGEPLCSWHPHLLPGEECYRCGEHMSGQARIKTRPCEIDLFLNRNAPCELAADHRKACPQCAAHMKELAEYERAEETARLHRKSRIGYLRPLTEALPDLPSSVRTGIVLGIILDAAKAAGIKLPDVPADLTSIYGSQNLYAPAAAQSAAESAQNAPPPPNPGPQAAATPSPAVTPDQAKPKRTMSPEGRARVAEATRARHAAAKQAKEEAAAAAARKRPGKKAK